MRSLSALANFFGLGLSFARLACAGGSARAEHLKHRLLTAHNTILVLAQYRAVTAQRAHLLCRCLLRLKLVTLQYLPATAVAELYKVARQLLILQVEEVCPCDLRVEVLLVPGKAIAHDQTYMYSPVTYTEDPGRDKALPRRKRRGPRSTHVSNCAVTSYPTSASSSAIFSTGVCRWSLPYPRCRHHRLRW